MNNNILNGKSAIVIGGGSGTGREVSRKLVRLGANVEVWGRDASKLESAVAAGDSTSFAVVDVSNAASVWKNVDRVRAQGVGVDFIVNSAGVWTDGALSDISEDVLDAHINIIVKGGVLAAQAALKLFDGTGHYVQIAAASAKPGFVDTALNTLAKRALDGLHEGLSREIRSSGVKLTTIYPDSIAPSDAPEVADGSASSYSDVAEVIIFALTSPPSVDVEEIVITARTTGRWN